MLKTKYLIGYVMITSVLLSCTKSNSYDIKGETDVKFFANITSSGNAPQNSISYSVVNIPDASGGGLLNLSATMPAAIKFPVFATRSVRQDVTIGAVLDTSLITVYNAAHGTNYKAFPAGMLNTDNLAAHILNGTGSSADSITITANSSGLNTLTDTTYMAPIMLTSVSAQAAGKITSNSKAQVVYIVANVEQRKIKYLAAASDALGALVTSRTPWSVTFTPLPSTTGSITDGSTTTYTRWAASPGQVDVNMQAAKNVTGIRLYTGSSATYAPTQVYVYLSNDGINYSLIGAPLKASLTYASGYNYILFYKAIQAQYIRLVLSYSTSTSIQNLRVTEFDVYAN